MWSQFWRTARTLGTVFIAVTCLSTLMDGQVGHTMGVGDAPTLWAQPLSNPARLHSVHTFRTRSHRVGSDPNCSAIPSSSLS